MAKGVAYFIAFIATGLSARMIRHDLARRSVVIPGRDAPDALIFSATMVAAALTNIKSAIRKVAKRITKGKVIKMAMKLTAALWWASACVVGMISTSPAESG